MAFTEARRRLLDYVRGAVDTEEALAAVDDPALNREDIAAAIRMVEDFREGLQHPTRWNCNRLLVTLERVRGRIGEGAR